MIEYFDKDAPESQLLISAVEEEVKMAYFSWALLVCSLFTCSVIQNSTTDKCLWMKM